ncbi:hypothetical protein A6B35_32805 (plasmid) [Mesorhizobium amorphae CCNWGS0123]|nr:hypothetical protein A6B35_32805 [Mesorhizobium amorphae CCNWGS0123]
MRGRQIEPRHVALATLREGHGPVIAIAQVARGPHPDGAGTAHNGLEGSGKAASRGLIGVKCRNAVRNDDKFHIWFLGFGIEAALLLGRANGTGRSSTCLLHRPLWCLAQAPLKGRLVHELLLLRGV